MTYNFFGYWLSATSLVFCVLLAWFFIQVRQERRLIKRKSQSNQPSNK